jgi:hypothetical protein
MARTLSGAPGSTATARSYRNPAEMFAGPAEDTGEDTGED